MTWTDYIPYANDIHPGLFIYVDFHFSGTNKTTQVLMKIDTGSSLTTAPLHKLKEDLGILKQIKDVECTDYNGTKKSHPVFVVNLKIQGNSLPKKEIIG